jgi:hypothetical protein
VGASFTYKQVWLPGWLLHNFYPDRTYFIFGDLCHRIECSNGKLIGACLWEVEVRKDHSRRNPVGDPGFGLDTASPRAIRSRRAPFTQPFSIHRVDFHQRRS